MSTSDIAYLIDDNQKDLIEFYIKHGFRMKNADIINNLYNKMMNPKFVKALKKVAKNGSDEGKYAGLDTGFVVIINGFIEKNHKNEAMTEEILSEYTDLINKILKSRIKDISKTVGISNDIVKELLVIVPNKECISNERAVGFYCQKLLRKMYIIAAENDLGITDTKTIKKIFGKLFGKKLLDLIAVYMLLEKKEYMKNFNENQITLWNLITDFALEYINKQDKEHIIELIEYYCGRRKSDAERNRDSARRISMAHIDAERYPALAKSISKFSKKGKESLVKFL